MGLFGKEVSSSSLLNTFHTFFLPFYLALLISPNIILTDSEFSALLTAHQIGCYFGFNLGIYLSLFYYTAYSILFEK